MFRLVLRSYDVATKDIRQNRDGRTYDYNSEWYTPTHSHVGNLPEAMPSSIFFRNGSSIVISSSETDDDCPF